jgi:hypothetical protein
MVDPAVRFAKILEGRRRSADVEKSVEREANIHFLKLGLCDNMYKRINFGFEYANVLTSNIFS